MAVSADSAPDPVTSLCSGLLTGCVDHFLLDMQPVRERAWERESRHPAALGDHRLPASFTSFLLFELTAAIAAPAPRARLHVRVSHETAVWGRKDQEKKFLAINVLYLSEYP